jgi:hypothetical protein
VNGAGGLDPPVALSTATPGSPPATGASSAGGFDPVAGFVLSPLGVPPAAAAGVVGGASPTGVTLLTGVIVEGPHTVRCALAMAITPSTTTVTNTEIRITRRFMASLSW